MAKKRAIGIKRRDGRSNETHARMRTKMKEAAPVGTEESKHTTQCAHAFLVVLTAAVAAAPSRDAAASRMGALTALPPEPTYRCVHISINAHTGNAMM